MQWLNTTDALPAEGITVEILTGDGKGRREAARIGAEWFDWDTGKALAEEPRWWRPSRD